MATATLRVTGQDGKYKLAQWIVETRVRETNAIPQSSTLGGLAARVYVDPCAVRLCAELTRDVDCAGSSSVLRTAYSGVHGDSYRRILRTRSFGGQRPCSTEFRSVFLRHSALEIEPGHVLLRSRMCGQVCVSLFMVRLAGQRPCNSEFMSLFHSI